MKKRLIRNLCQIIIWGGMLFMSYNYVQAHGAEKVNFISWLQLLKGKITSIVGSFFGDWSTAEYARQQNLIRDYKELQSFMELSNCPSLSVTQEDFAKRLEKLEQLTPKEYVSQALLYSQYASEVYTELEQCKNTKE